MTFLASNTNLNPRNCNTMRPLAHWQGLSSTGDASHAPSVSGSLSHHSAKTWPWGSTRISRKCVTAARTMSLSSSGEVSPNYAPVPQCIFCPQRLMKYPSLHVFHAGANIFLLFHTGKGSACVV
jgi:hypothetical protein